MSILLGLGVLALCGLFFYVGVVYGEIQQNKIDNEE